LFLGKFFRFEPIFFVAHSTFLYSSRQFRPHFKLHLRPLGPSRLLGVTRPGATSTIGAPTTGSGSSATWAPRTMASSCQTPTRQELNIPMKEPEVFTVPVNLMSFHIFYLYSFLFSFIFIFSLSSLSVQFYFPSFNLLVFIFDPKPSQANYTPIRGGVFPIYGGYLPGRYIELRKQCYGS
jgi:hypothetical protein